MRKNSVILAGAAVAALALTGASFAAGGGAPRVAPLTGAAEAPGPGDADGSGSAVVRVNYGKMRVCWQLSVANIDPATAAHIHVAPAGVAGPVVVPLTPPDATTGKASGCTTLDNTADNRTLLKNLIQKPGDYYVNVHNAVYPAGAVRGQLSKPGAGAPKPGKPVK